MNVKEVIKALGGPAQLARDLGFKGTNGMRRVSMWGCRNEVPRYVLMTKASVFGKYARPLLAKSRNHSLRYIDEMNALAVASDAIAGMED